MSDEFTNSKCAPSDCATCGLNCGGADPEEGHSTISLTLEDDTEVECAILTVFPIDEQEYIALLPLDEDGGNEDGDVWIYRFIRDTTGGSDHDLQNIEDDDEYDRAADKFDEWLDTQEFEGFDIEE